MTCPTCGGELAPGARRCLVCEPLSTPRVDGALAADPRLVTPPARAKARPDPLRDAPGLAQSRRHATAPGATRSRSACARAGRSGRRRGCPSSTSRRRRRRLSRPRGCGHRGLPSACETTRVRLRRASRRQLAAEAPESGLFDEELGDAAGAPLAAPELSEVELADLPLRPAKVAGGEASAGRMDRADVPREDPPPGRYAEVLAATEVEPEIELAPPTPQPASVERPARAGERAQAAALDAALFALLCLVVVYFTGRTARVGLGGARVGLAVARSRTRGCSRSSMPVTSPARPARHRAS